MLEVRWLALVALVFGTVFLVSGLFVDAEINRIVCMVFSGVIVLMGIFALIMMGRIM